MKKALILASVPSMIEQFNMSNIKILQDLGYSVDVAANFDVGGTIDNNRLETFKEELKQKNIKYINIPFSRSPFSKNNIKAYKTTKKIVKESKYELIHLHSPIGGVCGRLAARKQSAKVIYTAHGFHFFKGAPLLNWMIYYPIEKILAKYTDCLITINEEDYQRAKRKLKAKDIQLVHGVGVDKGKFDFHMPKEEKIELRKSLGLTEDDFVIIQVGELNKNKNQIMSIKAMKELVKEKDNIHLLLVGKGVLEGFYKQKIEEYNLKNNVHILGYRTDIPKLFKISNLLLSLSYREGLPVNVIEGLISGLPVIASNCRGNNELVKDGVNGYIIENEKELIERILKIKLEKKTFKSDTSKYEKEEINKSMRKIYNSTTEKEG